MNDVFCIGEMVIDFIPGMEKESYIRRAGGAPANVAVAVVKNGLRASMCCKVGEDEFGHYLLNVLRNSGVEIACESTCEEAITTMAFVTLEENGERNFTFARKPGADTFLRAEDVKERDLENSYIVHAGSVSLSAMPAADATRKALRYAHEQGKLVSFDVNYRGLIWQDDAQACRKAVFEILPYVDFLKISEEEAEILGDEETLFDMMEKYGIALIVETLGNEGVRAFYKEKKIFAEGYRVNAVDTTGAGDAFWGAFLARLRLSGVKKTGDLNEQILADALNYGNISGSICVQRKGAIAAIPTREEIENYFPG